MTAVSRRQSRLISAALAMALVMLPCVLPVYSAEAAEVSEVPTPDFTGKTLEQARALAMVGKDGQPARIFSSISTQGPVNGVVIGQYPAAEVPVYPGRMELTLTFGPPPTPKPSVWTQILQGLIKNAGSTSTQGSGADTKQPAETTTVPPLSKDSCGTAAEVLRTRLLRVSCSGASDGLVVQQYPPAGTLVQVNTEVSVTLRTPLVVVPSLANLTQAAAIAVLGKRGLQLGSVTGAGKSKVALPIVSQLPDAGTSVPLNSAVDVTLESPGLPPAVRAMVVPYLLKLSADEARSTLDGVGLVLGEIDGSFDGAVDRQSPKSGTKVSPGSSVRIWLAVPIAAPVAVPVLPNPPPPPPPWGWIGAAAAVAILGIGLAPRIWRWIVPDPVVSIAAHLNGADAIFTSKVPAGLKFSVSLRDQPVAVTYRIAREPEVIERGGKR